MTIVKPGQRWCYKDDLCTSVLEIVSRGSVLIMVKILSYSKKNNEIFYLPEICTVVQFSPYIGIWTYLKGQDKPCD